MLSQILISYIVTLHNFMLRQKTQEMESTWDRNTVPKYYLIYQSIRVTHPAQSLGDMMRM